MVLQATYEADFSEKRKETNTIRPTPTHPQKIKPRLTLSQASPSVLSQLIKN
jgi:hypothetical protein